MADRGRNWPFSCFLERARENSARVCWHQLWQLESHFITPPSPKHLGGGVRGDPMIIKSERCHQTSKLTRKGFGPIPVQVTLESLRRIWSFVPPMQCLFNYSKFATWQFSIVFLRLYDPRSSMASALPALSTFEHSRFFSQQLTKRGVANYCEIRASVICTQCTHHHAIIEQRKIKRSLLPRIFFQL